MLIFKRWHTLFSLTKTFCLLWGYIRVTYWLLWSYSLKLTHWNWRTKIDLLKLSDWTCKKVTHWNWETKTNWLNDSDRLNLTVQNRQTETDKLKMTDWKSLSDTNWLKLTDLYQVGAIDLWSCFNLYRKSCLNISLVFDILEGVWTEFEWIRKYFFEAIYSNSNLIYHKYQPQILHKVSDNFPKL